MGRIYYTPITDACSVGKTSLICVLEGQNVNLEHIITPDIIAKKNGATKLSRQKLRYGKLRYIKVYKPD